MKFKIKVISKGTQCKFFIQPDKNHLSATRKGGEGNTLFSRQTARERLISETS